MACRLAFVALLATAALVSGCGGAAAQIPESASLAPADAVVFARFTTDDQSSQWQKAERVLERIPGVRDALVSAIEQGLTDEGLDWDEDVAPALGDEVVIVVTAKHAADRLARAGQRGEARRVAREERRGRRPRRR